MEVNMKLYTKKTLVVLGLVLNIGAIFGMETNGYVSSKKYPEFAKFLHKYRCSPEVEQKANGETVAKDHLHNTKLFVYGGLEGTYPYIKIYPEVVVKPGNIDRIINAERIRQVITTLPQQQDRPAVPKKCMMWKDGNWHVVSERVDLDPEPKEVSLRECQQLTEVMLKTGLTDLASRNVGRDVRTGKLYLLDTENDSFHPALIQQFVAETSYRIHPKVLYTINFNNRNRRGQLKLTPLSSQAKQWLVKRARTALRTNRPTPNHLILPNNTQFDRQRIDFEQVKKEFASFQETKDEQEYQKYSESLESPPAPKPGIVENMVELVLLALFGDSSNQF